jgi:hypothetical protein
MYTNANSTDGTVAALTGDMKTLYDNNVCYICLWEYGFVYSNTTKSNTNECTKCGVADCMYCQKGSANSSAEICTDCKNGKRPNADGSACVS